ncbi:MAG TPA: MauE/DoxX family redox-associated membrane protein [Chthoniobacterales bacterium]|nr:MauE/DoxX family redox-associated membrane protein [Chthoniobacterales bacterium]
MSRSGDVPTLDSSAGIAMETTSDVQPSEADAPSAINHQPSTILWRILAIIIGVLFVYAGAVKVVDPVEFAGDIHNYHVLPWKVNVLLAFYLPWLEIACGLALIFRRLYSGALALVLALMIVFIGATIAAKARGIDISCGCFGHVSDQLSFAWHLVLDFAILAAVAGLWFSERHAQPKRAAAAA